MSVNHVATSGATVSMLAMLLNWMSKPTWRSGRPCFQERLTCSASGRTSSVTQTAWTPDARASSGSSPAAKAWSIRWQSYTPASHARTSNPACSCRY